MPTMNATQPDMSTQNLAKVECPVVVLTLLDAQIQGDEMADSLRDQFLAVAVQSQARNVVLDFGPVQFLSSAGFRPLLSLHRFLRQHGGKLLLAGLSAEVRHIFELMRLIPNTTSATAPFEVYPDAPSAVASLYR